MPNARVTVSLTEIDALPKEIMGRIGADDEAYFIARIGPRFIGRSDRVTADTTKLEFAPASRWQFERQFSTDSALVISLELWVDRGETPPLLLLQVRVEVAYSVSTTGLWRLIKDDNGILLRYEIVVFSDALGSVAAARTKPGEGVSAVLNAMPIAHARFTKVEGLYEPVVPDAGAPDADLTQHSAWEMVFSQPRVDKFARDDRGRAYLNRDPAGAWTSKSQYIDLTVEVRAVRGVLPADAGVMWTAFVPDDPVVEDPQVRREARKELQNPFFIPTFKRTVKPQGTQLPGNHGMSTPSNAWESLPGFDAHTFAPERAFSKLSNGVSRVRLHLPHLSGDRVVIKADVHSLSTRVASIGDSTGMITTWHRLDTEYRPIEGSTSLRGAAFLAARGFEAACVQLDFHGLAPVPVPNPSWAEQQQPARKAPSNWVRARHLGFDEDSEDKPASLAGNDAALFPHKGSPGWFSLASGLLASPPTPPTLTPGTDKLMPVWTGSVEFLSVTTDPQSDVILLPDDAPSTDVRRVELAWNGQFVTFRIARSGSRADASGKQVRFFELSSHDLVSVFDSSDGKISNLYSARVIYRPRTYGFSAATPARFYAVQPSTDGISPTVGKFDDYFGGRLLVFTWHWAYRDPITGKPHGSFNKTMSGTILHELTHAIGAPHKCGHQHFRHDSAETCASNYEEHGCRKNNNWIPGTVGVTGAVQCAVHVSQIRRVVLQENALFQSLNW